MDEAYFHFCGETVMDLVGKVPNLIVARTFSKAYGLAGLRVGVLAGSVETMQVGPPRALSLQRELSRPGLFAGCARRRRAYLEWYVQKCWPRAKNSNRLSIAFGVRFWPSRANFILVQIGPTA